MNTEIRSVSRKSGDEYFVGGIGSFIIFEDQGKCAILDNRVGFRKGEGEKMKSEWRRKCPVLSGKLIGSGVRLENWKKKVP